MLRKVSDPESVADHMYRMSVLSFLVDTRTGLNRERYPNALLQIRRENRDNLGLDFLIFDKNILCDPLLHLANMVLMRDHNVCVNPIAPRKAKTVYKIVYNFGLSECK